MQRYIDAEKIDLKLGVPLQDASGELYIPLRDVVKAIAQTPTEDVVPKSVFERPNKTLDSYLLHYGLVNKRGLIDEAKREVAKEIFEEIDKILVDYKIDRCLEKWGLRLVVSNRECIEQRLSELKNKYTEGDKEG